MPQKSRKPPQTTTASLALVSTPIASSSGAVLGGVPATFATPGVDVPSRFTRRGEQAVEAFEHADRLDILPREVTGDDEAFRHHAEHLRARGHALLEPAEPPALGTGHEVMTWADQPGDAMNARAWIVDTLEKSPHAVAVGASTKRTHALHKVGILEPALDAAESIQATNVIEKMLAHQLTACHFTALDLLELSQSSKLQAGERARLTNAAARQMEIFQNGCLALQKLKMKGTQRIIVQQQQVNVGPGGRAIVAGKLGPGSRRRQGPGRRNRK